MIEGKKIRLRSWCENDLPQLTDLRNDIKIQSQLLSRVRGSNSEQTRQWLEKRCTDSNSLFLIIADKKTEAPLGYIQFIEIDPIDQHAKMGICLAPESQGNRLGEETISLALKYVHNSFAVRKVFLEVRADNKHAIRCYEKIGFKTCGVFHEHIFIGGRWHDIVLMELFFNPPDNKP